MEYIKKMFDKYSTNKRRFKRLIKRRKRLFRRKYFLMKKFKRLKIKKTRIGILHFRSYYSNYYVTLTDLSYNVICSFSAGSVSESNNKKTKMSKVVAMPIFFRILQFLKAYRIRRLKVIIRNRMDKMFYSALDFFKKKGYKFKSFSFVSRNAHHLGQRTKKPRRI
jgi:ribosomal protein S11